MSALLLMALGLVLGGCKSSPPTRPGTTGEKVADIQFEGIESVDELELLDALETQVARFNPFAETPYFNRFALSRDIERIETFYHMRGFFDARVTSYDVSPSRRDDRVDVTFEVSEGEPSILYEVEYDTSALRQIDGAALTDELQLRVGTRYDHTAVEADRTTMQERMQENSYAYARVDARVYVNRESREARVYYFFDPGPASVFGEITVSGNRQIRDQLIIDRLRLSEGNTYRHSLLRRSQVALYDMNAFTYVAVEAQLRDEATEARLQAGLASSKSAQQRLEFLRSMASRDQEMEAQGWEFVGHARPEYADEADTRVADLLDQLDEIELLDPDVPILVEVVESPAATYRTGGGIGIEAGRTELYALGRAVWRNVVAPLNQVQFDTRLGYAWLPNILDPQQNRGIIGGASVGYSRPAAIFNYFDLRVTVGYERDLLDDYAYNSPSATIAFERRLTEFARYDFGYTINIVTTDDDSEVTGNSCRAVPPAFRLTHGDASIQYDARDNPLAAREGLYAELSGQVGVNGPVGEYSYFRLNPDLRYYQPMGRRVSLALRGTAGTMVDFGENVPRSQCMYLGGGDTVRGIPQRRLSPRDEGTATGGLSMYLFNIEPRVEIGRDWLYGVVFLDGGMVALPELTYNFKPGGEQGLQMTTGGGLRILTPIGPFRLDVGYRFTDGPQYGNKTRDRIGFYLSIGEAF